VAADMEFCLLGPLLVRRGKTALPVLPGKQRVLLAALLLRANRMVSLDELTEMMWGPAPPVSARSTLRNYVKELRKTLAVSGDSRLITVPGGYQIRATAAELDLSRFDALQADARACAGAGAWDEASAQLREALSLWRGEPLADVPSEPLVLREVPRLAELRLQAIEGRIEADLQLGRHADVIAELRHLSALHPFRERLHGQLMLALYRDGRQAEALAAYADARRVMVEELGAEPGTGLRELHHQMLTASPALELPEAKRPTVGRREPPVPRELPADVAYFTGRARELAALGRLLDAPGDQMPGTVVISAIGGTAGVGKTALAVHWAHQAAGRFPDGQLYVNLRGYDPAQPVTPADALAGFLRSLGVAGQDIPTEEADRAARYRSLLAGRRMLVVLDNAGSAEQVRPLLPGEPACAVVVTSRDALTGLVARDGARHLDLDLLPLQDAAGLLRVLIGGRADADPQATAALAIECARLPLALRVAAELAATRPAAPLRDLAGELADQHRRLDLLDVGGDPRTAFRAVFSWSYLHLDAAAARTFRLLGLHPGADFELYAAAALTGATLEQTDRTLTLLARAHLIQPSGSSGSARHGMHDLLHAYAAEQAVDHHTEPDRQQALTRLFDHYLRTAAAAMDILFPAEHPRLADVPPSASPAPPVVDPAAARAWLDAHRATLVAVAAYAADCGWPGHTTRLATILFRYLEGGGHYPEIVAIYSNARRAACRAGDKAAEAEAHNCVCLVDLRQARYQQAASHLQEALALYREIGNQNGQARALSNLGIVKFQQGRYRQAIDHQQQALALHQQTKSRADEARTLNNLGFVELRQGRYQRASDHLRQALTLFRQAGDPAGEALALGNLGRIELRQGHYQRASDHLRQALALYRQTFDLAGEAESLTSLGSVDLHQGRYQQATSHHRQALALFGEIGDRSGEAEARNGLGSVFLATGQADHARAEHAAALTLASQIGDKYQQAHAHDGLARAHHAASHSDEARRHWRHALILYTDLGAPEASQIRAQLIAARKDACPEHC
jgi:DNA-binding SARP family transcriptional activator/Tfp pilus assembly protein PilF